MKYILLIFTIHILYSAAPSAFGAGDLSLDTPYGLTVTEKAILANKKKLKKLAVKYNFQNQNQNNIKDDLSTLKSLISSNLSTSSQLRKNLEKHLYNIENKISDINTRIKFIEDKAILLEETINNLNNINETLKTSFLELKDIILNINSTFVTQEELNLIKKLIPKPKIKISNKKMAKLANKAYRAKKYTKAKNLYKTLLKNKYRPAKSNFYLGEISYRQKKYKIAIKFYQESVNLYAKAKYIPLLLYHTAMSYVNIGEKEQAKNFFDSIISNFPKTQEYKWTKKELKKRYK
jgi:TolA-binding protein